MLTWNTRPKIKTGKQNIQKNIADREEAGRSVNTVYYVQCTTTAYSVIMS